MNDLPLLLEHFLEEAAQALKKKKPTPPKELLTLLATYSFPGNIREFESMVFDAVSHHTSKVLSMDHFKEHIKKDASGLGQPGNFQITDTASAFSLFEKLPKLSEVSGLLIKEAMERAEDNQSIAAQMLGITRSGLNKALKRSSEK